MKCAQCGHDMERMEGIHRYDESGLKDVLLINIPIYKCPSCKETEIEIPAMEELHLLLAFLVLFQPDKLKADEVRYLRGHLGYSQEELASLLGVTRVTIARWESGKTIRLDQDKHLRRFYVEKMKDELNKLPEINRILLALVDRLPLESRPTRRLRREDWMPRQYGDPCSVA